MSHIHLFFETVKSSPLSPRHAIVRYFLFAFLLWVSSIVLVASIPADEAFSPACVLVGPVVDTNSGSSVPQPPKSCSNVAFPIPDYLEVHVVINKNVPRSQFSNISKWYTEAGNVQRFQLHEGDQNQQNPKILRPRVEAYAPPKDVWMRQGQNDWHEFSANYYLESWENPWKYAVFQIKTDDQSNFIIQVLIEKDGKLVIARRSKGQVTIDDNVFRKPFHLRVRSNGYRFQVYHNCKLILEEDHPQPQFESDSTRYGWRWGLYRQKEEADDKQKGTITMFVTGPKWD